MSITYEENLDVPIPVLVSGNVTIQSGVLAVAQISGQTLQLQSGTTVQLPATQVVKVSGELFGITSGQTIQLPATQVVKTSGEQFVLASGGVIDRDLLSGVGVLVTFPAEQLVTVSGDMVQLQSGTTVQLPSTQVVKISGEATARVTNSVILISGLSLSNELVYSGASFTRFDTATFVVEYLGGGSGALYRIRGHPITDIAPAIIGSGMAAGSGTQTAHTITGAYEYIDIGLANLQTDFSGTASAILSRR